MSDEIYENKYNEVSFIASSNQQSSLCVDTTLVAIGLGGLT